jgi:hypothetical protein
MALLFLFDLPTLVNGRRRARCSLPKPLSNH